MLYFIQNVVKTYLNFKNIICRKTLSENITLCIFLYRWIHFLSGGDLQDRTDKNDSNHMANKTDGRSKNKSNTESKATPSY